MNFNILAKFRVIFIIFGCRYILRWMLLWFDSILSWVFCVFSAQFSEWFHCFCRVYNAFFLTQLLALSSQQVGVHLVQQHFHSVYYSPERKKNHSFYGLILKCYMIDAINFNFNVSIIWFGTQPPNNTGVLLLFAEYNIYVIWVY